MKRLFQLYTVPLDSPLPLGATVTIDRTEWGYISGVFRPTKDDDGFRLDGVLIEVTVP